jgi:hypothetical protein
MTRFNGEWKSEITRSAGWFGWSWIFQNGGIGKILIVEVGLAKDGPEARIAV